MVYWGPPLWKSIHAITRSYPDAPTKEIKNQYQTFIMSLGPVLPCPNCREHYKKYVSGVNWDDILKDHQSFVQFGIDFHNDVNKRTGKPEMSNTDALKLVYSGHADTSYNDTLLNHTVKNTMIILLLVVLIIIGIILYNTKSGH
jgi:hypothetical protein